MISLKDYWMGRDKDYPPSVSIQMNASELIARVNDLFDHLNITNAVISSGYRPGVFNKNAGGSKMSAHMTGEAIDISDQLGRISVKITEKLLEQFNLYMESPLHTIKIKDGKKVQWLHLQTRKTKSGKRVFIP